MRSILVLFALAAFGFAFILQKNDPPEPVTAKIQSTAFPAVAKHNLMKHALEKDRSVAQNVSAVRKSNEL